MKFLTLIFILLIISGCGKSKNTDSSTLESGNNLPDCPNTMDLSEPCIVRQADIVITNQLGADITEWSSQGANSIGAVLATGLYLNKTIQFSDTDLLPENIRSGVSLFGVTGTAAGVSGNCQSEGVQSVICSAGVGSYWTTSAGGNLNGNDGISNLTIPEGYYSGAQQFTANDSDLVASKIVSGVNIFGTVGTLVPEQHALCASNGEINCLSSGSFVAGAPVNSFNLSNGILTSSIPQGFYDGSKAVTGNDSNLVASNIRNSTSIFGVNGTLQSAFNACVEDSLTLNAQKCSTSSNRYVSASAGSHITIWSNILGSTSVSGNIIDGIYSSKSCSFVEPNLIAGNIKNGVNLFGVSGNFVSAYSACSEDNGVSNATKCSTSAGRYVSSVLGSNITTWTNSGATTTVSESIPDGYYHSKSIDFTDSDLTSSNIVLNKEIFGVTGAMVEAYTSCSDEVLNASQCSTAAGRYVYTDQLGGRTSNCSDGLNASPCWTNGINRYMTGTLGSNVTSWTNAASGTTVSGNISGGYYSGRSISMSEPNLISSNIKSGVSIFNVTGNYDTTGVVLNSYMHRDKSFSPISLENEVVTNAATNYTNDPTGYRAIPDITKDDDGSTGSTNVTLVDRSNWNTLCDATTGASGGSANSVCKCGLSGSIAQRIADCAAHGRIGSQATWDGTTKGNAGQSVWKLVTRTGNITSNKGREVWRDERTQLLWSSIVAKNINWCMASGNNNITNNPAAEDDSANICDNSANQTTGTGPTNKAISACFEDGENYFTNTGTGLDSLGKGGLNRSSSPRVDWRLPTLYDYEMADADGIKLVMPDMTANGSWYYEWMSTAAAITGSNAAWTLYGDDSFFESYILRSETVDMVARCVGR